MLSEHTNEYVYWNDTSVAHMFTRLITKTNHPYNNTPLTIDKFNKDYNMLKDYIEWRKERVKTVFSLYNFTYNNMINFLQLIDFDKNNTDELIEIWKNTMMIS